MVDNSVNFKKRSYDDIFLSLMIDAYSEGLLSTDADFLDHVQNTEDIENILILDYSIIAYQLSVFYEDAEKIYQSKDLNLASGIDLDNIGKEKGISRPPATYPETLMTFYVKTTPSQDIVIPRGTKVGDYTDNSPIYTTLEDATISAGSTDTILIDGVERQFVQVNARCDTPSYEGHVNAGDLREIISSSNALGNVYCINTKGSSGGRPAYDDDSYRELLRKWASVFQRGNLNSYVDYLERVDGLDSYYLIPRWNYPGTIKIVCDPPTNNLIRRIQSDCETTVGLCKETVTVVGAEEKPIQVSCICNVDIDEPIPYSTVEKERIAEQIKQAIYEYVMGFEDNLENIHYSGLLIGQDFIPFQCANYVNYKIPEVKDVSFLNVENPYDTEDNGEITYHPAENIPISNEEIATINLDSITVTVQ